MAKTEIQKEEKIIDIDTIEKQREALSVQISGLLSEINTISNEIQQVEQTKAQAKTSYENCLDQGDETGMSKALSLIREANKKRENLTESLDGFSGKIEKLRTQFNELMTDARNVRTEAEKKLEVYQNQFKETKLAVDQVHGVLDMINNLANTLQKSMPKEATAKPGDMRIEGNI